VGRQQQRGDWLGKYRRKPGARTNLKGIPDSCTSCQQIDIHQGTRLQEIHIDMPVSWNGHTGNTCDNGINCEKQSAQRLPYRQADFC
jgi:hypothetical protein